MLKSDFWYELPDELIAQTPIEPRDASRLMVVERGSGKVTHDSFCNIADYLNSGDLLIMNDSKVFPARLFPTNVNGEVLLLGQRETYVWECIGKGLKRGRVLEFAGGLTAQIVDVLPNANRLIRFDYSGDFFALLEQIGNMPLPPYITAKLQDKSRYNTVYAKEDGSAASPTAGLHFTDRVFARLDAKEIDRAFVTLHVGIGTFRPVKASNIADHQMHAEAYKVPSETAAAIAACKARGGRIVAVGTTSCRTLEACGGTSEPSGSTDIFITPGYDFKVIDALVTNFHLPESTLMMLVSAFIGRDTALAAYAEAIREKYRFFSFGDSMLIL
ncbi:MAG: tRNA preQ1(34) S-adenosylmethionine ribosyltransferase-isomerase QueA [Oscillospiraceae bacterium]|nr:tRNA preQ1(34) S-adenosylmethionine ribosyltransferase-isomerase QueA [Oscillospiraceae bacterium]